jgi:D-alanyl-D-alanine carboxypeptidase
MTRSTLLALAVSVLFIAPSPLPRGDEAPGAVRPLAVDEFDPLTAAFADFAHPALAAMVAPAPGPESPAPPVVQASVPPPKAPEAPEPAPGPVRLATVEPRQIDAAAVVVIDDESGAVLYQQNAHAPLPPASLTKLATAILVVESAPDLDVPVTIDVDSRRMPGSSVMGLVPGDEFHLRDLLYGLILPSGNDAAIAVARHTSGSEDEFVAQMNSMMRRMGLTDSTFADPHGLGGDALRELAGEAWAPPPIEHYSSAYDIAMLARHAMTLPDIAEVVSAPSRVAQGSREMLLRNTNSFLRRYEGADGMKTGFTDEAGRTLAASASRDGHRVHVVLLNAPDRFDDAAALLDWAFEGWCWPEDGDPGCGAPATQTALAIEAESD